MILKAQNGHLTKANHHLNEVNRAQKKVMIEVDNVLSDLQTMCKNALQTFPEEKEGAKKVDSKLSEIL